MASVFLGLGSNLGDREMNIRLALVRLEAKGVRIGEISTIIETSPVGGPPQGFFLNAVAHAETVLTPRELLETLRAVEASLGRVRSVKDGPRTIDIDILLYDDIRLDTPDLVIPHPRMGEREFVLRPLREIAPDLFDRGRPLFTNHEG